MKKRSEGWTCYLKTKTGRQALWFSIVLSATSLFAAGVSLSLQAQSVGQASSSTLPSDKFPDDHFLTFNGIDNAESACSYYNAIGAIRFPFGAFCQLNPDVAFGF